uniref:Uncharacterized protein n=1 Tax=Myotis myotis TaxID=51298 RepID=A0A7J7VZ32_MYOMY|nr:hypothetical protein mMyoMyo1_012304 [Myotis myotis]
MWLTGALSEAFLRYGSFLGCGRSFQAVFSDGGRAGFREIGPILTTAPFFSGRVCFRVFGWYEPQRGLGQMATSPLEAWAGRDLPTWRQPNAAMAPNPSQARQFLPPASKMAARVLRGERSPRLRFPASVFGVHCGLCKVEHCLDFSCVLS